jgi:PAS domain S-box-containing protein
LLLEIKRLRERLEEAEETLSAIRYGQVDAFVVTEQEGERVYILKSPERLYRMLVEESGQGAAVLAEDGTLLYANAYLAELLGLPAASLLGQTFQSWVTPESRPLMEALLQGKTGMGHAEAILRGTAGQQVPVYLSLSCSVVEGGRTFCLVVTDLTEQKRQEQVMAAESLARSILEQVAEAIVVCDPDGKIIRASHAAHQLSGINPLLQPFTAAFPLRQHGPSTSSSVDNGPTPLQSALGGKVVRGVEASLERTDGHVFDVLLSAGPLRDARQQIIGCVVTLTDISERRRAEAALRESKERLNLALECAEAGSWDWDLVRDRVSWSDEYYRLYGLDPTKAAPSYTAWLASLHADDRTRIDQSVHQVLRERRSEFRSEFRIIHPTQGERWLTALGKVFYDPDGRAMRMAGIALDITERRQAERAKDELVSVVSHELRTPLTSIAGSLGLITGRVAGELPAQAQSLVEIAHRNSERLVRLVNDILDLDKIESGKMSLNLRPVDLTHLVEEALVNNRPYAQRFEVGLTLEERLPGVKANADPDRLMQVMTNLISNAVKFSPPHQAVSIRMMRLDGYTRILVTDRGPGIPEDFRHRIFQRFSQADMPDSPSKSGTGLGLSISKAIVERLGGRIGFDSVSGQGTTFYFELPEWRGQ